MYVSPNAKSKAELKRWIKEGKRVTVFAPGLGEVPENGKAHVEGPHYPKPHSWYGVVFIENGVVVSVR